MNTRILVKSLLLGGLSLLLPAAAAAQNSNRAPALRSGVRLDTLIQVKAGQTLSIDASGWFEDADGDRILLSAESQNTSLAEALISGNLLIIKGRKTGRAPVRVTARDGKKAYTSTLLRVQINGAGESAAATPSNRVTLSDTLEASGIQTVTVAGLRGMRVSVRTHKSPRVVYVWTVSGSGDAFENALRNSAATASRSGALLRIDVTAPGQSSHRKGVQADAEESWIKQLLTGSNNKNNDWNRKSLEQHFEVLLPEGLGVTIESDLSEVQIADITGGVSVRNRAGQVETAATAGRLEIENRYGVIRVRTHTGEAILNGKSGEIDAQDIKGPVKVTSNYSAIGLIRVEGRVEAENESGKIVVKDIQGDAVLRGRYGSVRAESVSGSLQLINRSGSIEVEEAGSVTAENENGSTRLSRIRGTQNGSVRARNGSVELDRVSGSMQVDLANGSVESSEGRGALAVKTANGTIRIERHNGNLELTGEDTEVRVSSTAADQVRISTRNRPVELEFSSIRRLDLTTDGSDVRISLPQRADGALDIELDQADISGNGVEISKFKEVGAIRQLKSAGGGAISIQARVRNGSMVIRSRAI